MLVSSEKLAEVILKVKQIQAHENLYCISPERLPVSIDDLHWAIQDSYELTIEMFEVPFEGSFLKGMVERYSNGTSKVYIREEQSERDKRLTAAKELSHLMIDEKEDWSANGVGTIEDLIVEASFGSTDELAGREVQSENLALLAAYEILYPYTYRACDKKMIEADQMTMKSLAVYYEVPEFVPPLVLSDRYEKVIGAIWESL